MSNTTLNWQMREAMPHLRDEGRLSVLMCYILHGNKRNRAWPSVETIMKETGWGRASVVSAKSWLIEVGALEKVPMEERAGDEKKLHHRQSVMQITGKLTVGGKVIPFLYFNERTNEEVNSSESESSASESMMAESMMTEPEVVTNKKDIDKEKDISNNSKVVKPVAVPQSLKDLELDKLDKPNRISESQLVKYIKAHGSDAVLEKAVWYKQGCENGEVKKGGAWLRAALVEDWGQPSWYKSEAYTGSYASGKYAQDIQV